VKTLPPSTRKGGFGSTDRAAPLPNIHTYRTSKDSVILIDTSTSKNKIRRIARPIVQPLIHANDKRHHQSPHKDKIQHEQQKYFAATESMTTHQHNYEPSIFDMHLPDHPSSKNNKTQTNVPPSNTLESKSRQPQKDTNQAQQHISSTTVTTTPTSPVDRVNSSQPKVASMTHADLLRSIGFLKTTNLQKYMSNLGRKNFSIQRLPRSPKLDPGEVSTMHSNKRNKNTQPVDINTSTIWNIDIGFGPCTAIGGIKYTLLAINKRTKQKLIFGLTNLKQSLTTAMNRFLNQCGNKPTLIRTDFDKKLIGGEVRKLLDSRQILIEASPPYRQHQNGLVERHWQTIVSMTRNWLQSSLLPSKYWFFGVKRACEVLNMMPISINGKISTPYEETYNKKVDYRNLFPMFSTAYIKQCRVGGQSKNKWKSHTLKCIVVGKCNSSDSLLFYHPPSKQLLSNAEGYRFDTFMPAGPQLEEHFDGNFVFSLQSDLDTIHRAPTHEEKAKVFITTNSTPPTYLEAHVLSVPLNDDNGHYIVQETLTGTIQEVLATELLNHDPTSDPTTYTTTSEFPLMPWIKHMSKATIFLPPEMKQPKQGFLSKSESGDWSFIPGRAKTQSPIPLHNFEELAQSMLINKKLFQGWKPKRITMTARRTRATSNLLASLIINGKVSARDLENKAAPTLLKHHLQTPNDQNIWNAAYKAEYDGLTDIDTWELITEQEYQDLKTVCGHAMPTMAISTIKYDGTGAPIRAKYRIVALGNLDPHDWSKQDCFAPVMSQFELRFLTSLAVQKRCIPKTGDIKQAFCQSYLPENENYVCHPPPGCPITPKGMYLKLKKTLYGLKRSPRHFYHLAKKLLLQIGLKQHPTSPCLFHGSLIKGQPPLYLGLYVDDFIYFSESPQVEQLFEKEFNQLIDIDWNGKIGYFLGINFVCHRHTNNNVSILMNQEAFIDNLVQLAQLDGPVNEPKTPYRSGYPVDTIPTDKYNTPAQQAKITKEMQILLGCLNWLSLSTRPDISTISNMLAKYTAHPSKGHLAHAKYVIKYLKGTKSKGILFTTQPSTDIESFVKFPLPSSQITSLCDANWGPQDQSRPNPSKPLPEFDLFKSRSLSGYLIWLGGPIHWCSKRQKITARSSAESEIYATDECTKALLQLSHIIHGFSLSCELMKGPTPIYNDNAACVCWSKNTTTKGLRHIQIRENAIRESVINKFVDVRHCEGKRNLSDMFTKEDRDAAHYIIIRDYIMCDSIPNEINEFYSPSSGHSRVLGGVKLGLETQREPTTK
jgi:hypothetical protein